MEEICAIVNTKEKRNSQFYRISNLRKLIVVFIFSMYLKEQFNRNEEEDDQKRRAADRIHKLRNLSFNLNSADPNSSEFDAVPAYVRRNMELFGNTLTSVENFYSKYTVNKDDNDKTNISSINTFLDGKKPD